MTCVSKYGEICDEDSSGDIDGDRDGDSVEGKLKECAVYCHSLWCKVYM